MMLMVILRIHQFIILKRVTLVVDLQLQFVVENFICVERSTVMASQVDVEPKEISNETTEWLNNNGLSAIVAICLKNE